MMTNCITLHKEQKYPFSAKPQTDESLQLAGQRRCVNIICYLWKLKTELDAVCFIHDQSSFQASTQNPFHFHAVSACMF